jgi:hypothetical protein
MSYGTRRKRPNVFTTPGLSIVHQVVGIQPVCRSLFRSRISTVPGFPNMTSASGLTGREGAIDAVIRLPGGGRLDARRCLSSPLCLHRRRRCRPLTHKQDWLPILRAQRARHDRRPATQECRPAREHASREQFPRQRGRCINDVDMPCTGAAFRTGQGPSPKHRGYFCMMGYRY